MKADRWSWASTGTERCVSTSGRFWWLQEAHDLSPLLQQKAQLANRLLELLCPCLPPRSYQVKSEMLGSARRGSGWAGRSSRLGKGTAASCEVSWLSEVGAGQLFHLMPSFSTMALSSSFISVNSPHFCDPFLNREVFCSSGSFIFQNLDLSNILSY